MFFYTIFLYVILGWYHNNLGWKYCLIFWLRKKPILDQEVVYLLDFQQQIIMISSQNKVQKNRTIGHEQVFWHHGQLTLVKEYINKDAIEWF